MIILDVPKKFQQRCNVQYPNYSCGVQMEEILYELLIKDIDKLNNINSDYIYLPIFWTDYYINHNYGKDIYELYDYLDTLDTSKKYFTIVQYDSGIFVKNSNLNILVFGASGGINIYYNCHTDINYQNILFNIFNGNKPDISIPLLTYPYLICNNSNKDIYCSFVGSFKTHPIRVQLLELLSNPKFDNKFVFSETLPTNKYIDILNRSKFTLCPRGFGYTSYRLFEAIHCESVPIFIWDEHCILPYDDIIDWNKFSIVIHSNEIQNLPDILEKVNYSYLLNELKKVKYMFQYDNLCQYIINRIKLI